MKALNNLFISLIISVIFCSGCKKMIEVDTPQNQLTTDKVFADSTSAIAAVLNCYALFDKAIERNLTPNLGLFTDELIYPNSPTDEFIIGNLSTTNGNNQNIWTNLYFEIYSCNDAITQLAQSKNISNSLIFELSSEAKFLRALSYLYLFNLYHSVPLILETDVNKTATAAQADSITVYQQIVQDLKEAQTGLSVSYRGSGKVRANRYAATALLARTYLYQKDWANAELQATTVLNSGLYTPLQSPATVFLANSKETILSFWTQNGFVTDVPNLLSSSGTTTYPISPVLVNSFEIGDLRKTNWLKSVVVGTTTYYYQYKYHNSTANTTAPEYLLALRAGEQFLIRAEARAQQGNITGATGAIADLNVIRNRAGLANYSGATDRNTVLTATLHERQIELFTEWGHRYIDLKRFGLLNSTMSAYKTTWATKSATLPIPRDEITYDPNLHQNSGY